MGVKKGGGLDPALSAAWTCLGSSAVALLAVTMRGDWILIAVHFLMQRNPKDPLGFLVASEPHDPDSLLDQLYLRNAPLFILASLIISYLSFYGFGGALTWYFYIRQKDTPETWKCQPKRWLTADNEWHEFVLGSVNMAVGAIISGVIAAYIINGGYNQMYFSMMELGFPYLVGSTILFFLMSDAMAYYFHRAFHFPAWYKRFHKHHHRYHSPTIWSATAMHPVEFLILQFALVAPIFFIPIYSGAFIMLLLYNYYYGMVDHSGINMDAVWPWQPASIFHDNHHKYFHTNFGFNTYVWDWMHDTLRKEDREYGEDVFYGRGKQKDS